jgi:NADH:ubiquinone oxidoreductase subunit H
MHLIFNILINIIPLLICIAYFTVAERKLLSSVQRRVGPVYVGFRGLLQAFADGFKLILKEIIIPVQANFYLYFLAPSISLFLALIS